MTTPTPDPFEEPDYSSMSIMEQIAMLPEEEQEAALAGMDPEEIRWDWSLWGRPNQMPPKDDSWDVGIALAGRGYGKGLDISTPIMVYNKGFVPIGELQDGDIIVDEQGNPTKVLKAHDPYVPEKMYRFHFSDGSTLDTDAPHQWVTWTEQDVRKYQHVADNPRNVPGDWPTWEPTSESNRKGRRAYWSREEDNLLLELKASGVSTKEAAERLGRSVSGTGQRITKLNKGLIHRPTRVKTTEEIVSTFKRRGGPNHRIPTTAPIVLPEADQPLPAWVFGYLIGDGDTKATGRVATSADDREFLREAFMRHGFESFASDNDPIHFTVPGIRPIWSSLGMPNGKHIPDIYKYGSVEQRYELLRGLVDSDGTVSKRGQVHFTNTNKDVVDGFVFVARSLGLMPRVHTRSRSRRGVPSKTSYDVYLSSEVALATIPRKVQRQRLSWGLEQKMRSIVSYEEIEPKMVRCLTVDSPNSMYLAGEALIPTHNTRMAAEWIREKARDTSEGPRRFLLVARTAADVREVIVEGEALALDTPVASPQSPTGFIPIGKIKKGDTVVGGDGKYAKVTKVFPVLHNRPCYEIRVAGEPEPIIADANHKWLVRYRHGHWGTGRLHKTPVVRTTEEILAEFDRRWYIEPVEVQGERDIRLRYTPYNVGYILGQQPKTSEFTDHTAATRKIPEDYFWATPKIREAVLQGIVDARRSDGEGAQIPGTNTDRFRRDIRRLAASLGYRTSEYRKYSERDGVLFSWDLTRFSRRGSLRAIQSITPIESVPVRCIAVDSPDNTFLIHSTYVKTHNSGIMAVSPESERPEYRPSIRRLIWPNGNQAFCTSADEPDSLRGVQAPLDLETPISTPDGFKTLRTIDVGDYVHDENGAPARVTHVHPISEQKVYKVTFSDGSYVNATGDHGWVAHTAADRARLDQRYGVQNLPDNWGEWPSPYNRKEALTPETQKMVYDMVLAGIPQGVISETTGASVDQVKRLRKRFKEGFVPGYKAPRVTTLDLTQGHTIPATKPVQYAETAKLPLDPWVLGLALGGGKTHRPGTISVAEDDARDVVDRLNASGFPATARRNGKIKARGIPKLWDYQKEIPEEYLTASPEDRLALVQGLMDSGAVIEETGEFRFSSTDSELIDGLVRLLRSLGLLPRVTSHEEPTRLLDPVAVRLWQVQVVSNTPLVTLPRKLEMVPSTRWGRTYFERRVVSVEDVGTRLVRCITVDTESNLFLAGEGLIPTSNTHSWGDEIAAWRQPAKEGELSAWDNLRIATRLGPNPQVLATTTPKRVKVLFDLLEEQKRNPRIWLTRGSTFDNAGNLAGAYLDAITGVYGGTALAQQELYGEMLEAVDGALWTDETIPHTLELPPYTPHRVIGVDPTVAEEPGDECGIVVVSSTADKDLFRRRAWVLEDASIQGSPQVWAQKVVEMHRKWGAPVVAETNQGGALVKNAIHQIDPSIPVYEVHSKVGKKLRAEPVVLAYQQGRVTHVGQHVDLETQMITWEPENTRKSPDRIDALVHALTALLIQPPKGFWNGPIRAKGSADRQLNIGGIRNRPARTGPRATGFGQFRLGGMGKR